MGLTVLDLYMEYTKQNDIELTIEGLKEFRNIFDFLKAGVKSV